jgi:alpha-1,2-mannosyltransferase
MARTSARASAARLAVAPSALVATLVIAALALLIVISAAWAFRDGRGLLDWGSFWASGDAANHGEDPYGVYPDTFSVAGVPAPNLNPPISVYPFQLAAKFDAAASRDAWDIFTLVGFTVCVAALWRAYPERGAVTVVAAFALAGLWHTLELGQIYVPLLMALTAAWLLLRDGDAWQAGVALGTIAAIKPQFAIIPALLLLAGQWRAGASGLGTAALISCVPLVLEGPGVYRSWLDATPPITPANTLAGNSSLLAVFGRLELDTLGLLLTLVMVAAVALFVLWRKPPRLFVVGLGMVAALLAGPITWPGYTLLLLPLLFVAPWERLVPALVFLLVPYATVVDMVDANRAAAFAFGSVYAFGILLLAALVLPVLWREATPRDATAEDTRRPLSKRPVASAPRA